METGSSHQCDLDIAVLFLQGQSRRVSLETVMSLCLVSSVGVPPPYIGSAWQS